MIISIVGAHGSVARSLTPLLTSQGHQVRGIVRKDTQFEDVKADGARPVLCDIESTGPDELDAALETSDVVVFAAGAGPDSGPERKRSVDRDGAIKSVESAQRVGAQRFVIISSMGADDPPSDDEDFSVYLRAKKEADQAVRAAKIHSTIIRPGRLTDDAPKGRVTAAASVEQGELPRKDLAAVLAEVINSRSTESETFEVVTGDDPIATTPTSL